MPSPLVPAHPCSAANDCAAAAARVWLCSAAGEAGGWRQGFVLSWRLEDAATKPLPATPHRGAAMTCDYLFT